MCDVTGVDCSEEPSENQHTTKQLNSSTVINQWNHVYIGAESSVKVVCLCPSEPLHY